METGMVIAVVVSGLSVVMRLALYARPKVSTIKLVEEEVVKPKGFSMDSIGPPPEEDFRQAS